MPDPRRQPSALRSRVALAIASIALFLALWIVVPAPTYALLALGVGAPETSVWLLLASVVAIALAWPRERSRLSRASTWRSTSSRLAIALGTIAFALSMIPFARFPATARRLDAQMRAAIGAAPLRGADSIALSALRPRPMLIGELLGGVSEGDARITRGITVATPPGGALTADIYRPRTGSARPMVVQLYGGAWQRGDPGDNAAFARWLAARGYVVFAIDYRHAPAARWPAQLDDVRAALEWVRAHAVEYGGDTSRIALLGRSAGGHLAMMAAYTDLVSPPRAVVSFYGPADLVDSYRNPPSPDPIGVREVEEALIGGGLDALPDRYREASPMAYATRPQPPTLLIQGGRDHIVEARYGRRLAERLGATGTTVAYLEIPWAEHAFDAVFNGPSSQLALYHTERFLAWALAPGAPRAGSQR